MMDMTMKISKNPRQAPSVDSVYGSCAGYLSCALTLHDSGPGETGELRFSPSFDDPVVEITVDGGREDDSAYGEANDARWVILNRKQVECLNEFITDWLARTSK